MHNRKNHEIIYTQLYTAAYKLDENIKMEKNPVYLSDLMLVVNTNNLLQLAGCIPLNDTEITKLLND